MFSEYHNSPHTNNLGRKITYTHQIQSSEHYDSNGTTPQVFFQTKLKYAQNADNVNYFVYPTEINLLGQFQQCSNFINIQLSFSLLLLKRWWRKAGQNINIIYLIASIENGIRSKNNYEANYENIEVGSAAYDPGTFYLCSFSLKQIINHL